MASDGGGSCYLMKGEIIRVLDVLKQIVLIGLAE